MKQGGFVSGALTGALVGATLAMLLTPPSGHGMARRLREKAAERSGETPAPNP